jgi:hypothetical protein
MQATDTHLRDRIETGTELHVAAPYFPYGQTNVRVEETGVSPSFWPWNAKRNLSGDLWAFTAYEWSMGDTWFVIAGENTANVSYTREAAQTGAFSPIKLTAFTVE